MTFGPLNLQCHATSTSARVDTFVNALNVVILKTFVEKSIKFDIIVVDSGSVEIVSEVITRILKLEKVHDHQISVASISTLDLKGLSLTKPAIILANSRQELTSIKLFYKIRIESIDYPEGFMVLCVMLFESDNYGSDNFIAPGKKLIAIHPHYDYSHAFNYMLFMTQKPYSENIIISTIERFIQPDCNHQIQVINEFNYIKQQWDHEDFRLKTTTHFNGYKLKIYCGGCFQNVIPGEKSFLSTLLSALKNHMNFSFEEVHDKFDTVHFQIFVLNMYVMKDYHLVPDHVSRKTDFHIYPTQQESRSIVISSGESYSSFERMILPFDSATWIACGVFFTASFTVVSYFKRKHIGYQNFVFGALVRNPMFNIIVVFFGQGQIILPGRNLARYLLMMYILFCLIIRTGYQGVQFELMFMVSIQLPMKLINN